MAEPQVLTSRFGAVQLVELNRPARLNAMTKGLVLELLPVLELAAGDADIRCLVLTGVGRGFCAGGDLGEIEGIAQERDAQSEAEDLRVLHRTSLLLHDMPKPTIAAVNGPCAGAGLSWACAADIRIASDTAVFRHSFASAGLTGDFGSTFTLPRIVGTGKARELTLMNTKIDAAEALRIGLVTEVVPADAFRGRVMDLATKIAAQAPIAMAGIKANLNDGETMSFADLLDAEADRQAAATGSEDCAEAAIAFLEKRDPSFTGR